MTTGNRTLDLSPDAATRLSRLTTEAHQRIANWQEEKVQDYFEAYDKLETKEERNALYEAHKFNAAQYEIEVWRNLACTFASLIGLGGRVYLEDDRNFYGQNEFIGYGVNQSTNGTWSINS